MKNPSWVRFGQNIRRRREELGLTREGLVSRMDGQAGERSPGQRAPDVSTIARWERGEQCPRVANVLLLCEVLGTTPEELGYPRPLRRRR
ncbi:helix-turn-helix transcriptional regulator [Thermogemmatispora sp.]|uniref:helix-turn-helix transcriptional regulator n=1 Tax=Thermogemmatispora sp. TaxID=1968838 RepID=UPI0035E41932